MHTLGLGPSIVIISSAVSSRNYIVDYLDTSVNGYDNTLVSPPAFYVDLMAIGGVKSKETRSYQKGKCNSLIFSTETTHALKMC